MNNYINLYIMFMYILCFLLLLYLLVSQLLVKNQTMVPVLPIALDNRWFKPALLDAVLEYEGFTGPQIAEKVSTRLSQIK